LEAQARSKYTEHHSYEQH